MGILGWLVVGFIAGALARAATGARKRGCLGTIAIGIIGALLGGALFRLAMGDDFDSFDGSYLASIFVAFVGAALLLLVLEALDRSPRSGGGGRSRGRRWH
jgi:uncharacterized membrane protein YeaQ/YmgE (transglycosylase-associated protein family)